MALLRFPPAEAGGKTVDGHDLPERSACHMGAVAGAFDDMESARMRLGRRLGAHPAQDLVRIGQEGENGGKRRCDRGLASDQSSMSPRLSCGDGGTDVGRSGIARDKGGGSTP